MINKNKIIQIIKNSNFEPYIKVEYEDEIINKIEVIYFVDVAFFDTLFFIRNDLGFIGKIFIKKKVIFQGGKSLLLGDLSGCIFEDDVEFVNVVFNKELFFNNCKFRGIVKFESVSFNFDVTFSSSHFEKYVSFENSTFKEKSKFIRTFFYKDVNFIDTTFEGKTFFGEADFIVDGKKIIGKVDFTNAKFEKYVSFNDTKFKLVNFRDTIFLGKTEFLNVKFKQECNFKNTTFESLVNFYFAKFYSDQRFIQTDFLDKAIFSNVTFYGQVQFLYNKVQPDSFISFENADFRQSFDISRANFFCNMQVWGIKTRVIPSEYSVYIINKDQKTQTKKRALQRIRESYRRVKHEFKKEGNIIESIRFHTYEMDVYKKELSIKETSKGNKFIMCVKRIWNWLTDTIKSEEKIILWFNKKSNNFGKSWVRGVKFTFIITIIFYILFLLCISNKLVFDFSSNGLGRTFVHLLEFLNITKWDYKPFGIEDYTWAYGVLFIGRIFIGYGYYQTIQAFRKYRSN